MLYTDMGISLFGSKAATQKYLFEDSKRCFNYIVSGFMT
jgi:hypothetical protein